MINYEKASATLAAVGFVPGCLVKTKARKSFWKESGVPTIQRVKLIDGTYKEWAQGKEYAVIGSGSILMFLGLLTREVNREVADEKMGTTLVSSYGDYQLLCFFYEGNIVWWDYGSINGGASLLLDKFEVLTGE